MQCIRVRGYSSRLRPAHHSCTRVYRSPDVCSRAMKDKVAALPPGDVNVKRIRIPALDWSLENVDGKRASFAIYQYLARAYARTLDAAAARKGLELYDEVVEDALQRPGAHPNIDLLLKVRDESLEYEMVLDK